MKFSVVLLSLLSSVTFAEFYLQNCEGTFDNGTVIREVMVTASSDSTTECGQTDHGNKTFERGGPFNYEKGNVLMACQLHRFKDSEDDKVQGYAYCADGKNVTLYYTTARSVDEWDCGKAKYKCQKGALTNDKSKASSPNEKEGGSDSGSSSSSSSASASVSGKESNNAMANAVSAGLVGAIALTVAFL